MKLLYILIILFVIGIIIYQKRRTIRTQIIKYKISERKKKRISMRLDFDDDTQKRTVATVTRLIRESHSQLLKSIRHEEYYIWLGEIYVVMTHRSLSIINGKIVKGIIISEKVHDDLVDKFNTRVEANRNNLVKEIEVKNNAILDLISKDIESNIKTLIDLENSK